jgi:hypothetical protein
MVFSTIGLRGNDNFQATIIGAQDQDSRMELTALEVRSNPEECPQRRNAL